MLKTIETKCSTHETKVLQDLKTLKDLNTQLQGCCSTTSSSASSDISESSESSDSFETDLNSVPKSFSGLHSKVDSVAKSFSGLGLETEPNSEPTFITALRKRVEEGMEFNPMPRFSSFSTDSFYSDVKKEVNARFAAYSFATPINTPYLDEFFDDMSITGNYFKTCSWVREIILNYKKVPVGKPYIVTLSGNIGAGKSTLSEWLCEYLRFKGIKTHLKKELNDLDGKMVQRMYKGEIGEFVFQQYMLSRFAETLGALKKDSTIEVLIFDRDIQEQTVFRNVRKNAMNYDEHQMSLGMEGLFLATYQYYAFPHMRIFLDIPVSILMPRIEKRARKGENTVDETYLRDLAKEYKKFKSLCMLRRENIKHLTYVPEFPPTT